MAGLVLYLAIWLALECTIGITAMAICFSSIVE